MDSRSVDAPGVIRMLVQPDAVATSVARASLNSMAGGGTGGYGAVSGRAGEGLVNAFGSGGVHSALF